MATVNDIIFVSGGEFAVYGRIEDTHIAPRIDDNTLDSENIELLSNFQIVLHNDNIYFLVPLGIKTSVQKSLSTISTAYVTDTLDRISIFSTNSSTGTDNTTANPITQPTISTVK